MKKLLFLFLLFPMFLFSQTKIVLKGTQVTISSLANIAGLSVVANATGSPATPTAVLLGVGLTFSGGKLCIDTLNFKDTIYALNGLQILGVGYNRIGLGGFLSQNTTISGSNLYAFTLDSMQAATGRGFRVNFGLDAGWDIPVRDSATGFWTRIAKGNVGDVLTMLGAGGVGWGPGGGGGGSSTATIQTITSGSSGTVTGSNYWVRFNPASALASYTLTLPASPTVGQSVTVIFGGTITAGTVVTAFTVSPNTSQSIIDNTPPAGSSVTADNAFQYLYVATNLWIRKKL